MAKQASATTVNYDDLNASLTSRDTKFPLFQFGLTRRRWIEELWGHPTSLAHGFPTFVGSGHAAIFPEGWPKPGSRFERWSVWQRCK
jgi:hypothetical protein